jgi:uncharacterized membrane protein HdeD (DUF308 family)
MLESPSRRWRVVAVRGVVAALLGTMAVLWPGITLFVLILLLGLYTSMDGVLTLIVATRNQNVTDTGSVGRGRTITRGIFGIAIGVLALAWPGITAVALFWSITAWVVMTGVFKAVVAIRLRREAR